MVLHTYPLTHTETKKETEKRGRWDGDKKNSQTKYLALIQSNKMIYTENDTRTLSYKMALNDTHNWRHKLHIIIYMRLYILTYEDFFP